MTGGGIREVGYFSTDPGQWKGGFQTVAHQAIEAGDTENGIGGNA